MNQLTPPDFDQCQVEKKDGSFMTFGPRSWVRCTATPEFIATEIEPGKDGQIGSMSMCSECAKHVAAHRGDTVILVQIKEECH